MTVLLTVVVIAAAAAGGYFLLTESAESPGLTDWPDVDCDGEKAAAILDQIEQYANAAHEAKPPIITKEKRDEIVSLVNDCRGSEGVLEADCDPCGKRGDSCCACIKQARDFAKDGLNTKSPQQFDFCTERLDHGHGGDDD